jgi:hypothetical protein
MTKERKRDCPNISQNRHGALYLIMSPYDGNLHQELNQNQLFLH